MFVNLKKVITIRNSIETRISRMAYIYTSTSGRMEPLYRLCGVLSIVSRNWKVEGGAE